MRAGLCLMLLTFAACAGNPDEVSTSADGQYRQHDARIRAMEELDRLRAACARSGRVVAVRRYSASRLAPPLKDVDTAACW